MSDKNNFPPFFQKRRRMAVTAMRTLQVQILASLSQLHVSSHDGRAAFGLVRPPLSDCPQIFTADIQRRQRCNFRATARSRERFQQLRGVDLNNNCFVVPACQFPISQSRIFWILAGTETQAYNKIFAHGSLAILLLEWVYRRIKTWPIGTTLRRIQSW